MLGEPLFRHSPPPPVLDSHADGGGGAELACQLDRGRVDACTLARFLNLPLSPAPHPEWATLACRRYQRGDVLIRAGDPCRHVYIVMRGSVCTRMSDAEGKERVIGFELSADALGLDGLASGRHTSDSIVLEPTDVAVIPLASLARPGHEGAALGAFIYRLLGRQIIRDKATLAIMAASRSTNRLGAFLLDWYERSEGSRTSPCSVALPMSRLDIASFLGLSRETVSRVWSVFDRAGIAIVHQRRLTILDIEALHRTAASAITRDCTHVQSFRCTTRRQPTNAARPIRCTDLDHAQVR